MLGEEKLAITMYVSQHQGWVRLGDRDSLSHGHCSCEHPPLNCLIYGEATEARRAKDPLRDSQLIGVLEEEQDPGPPVHCSWVIPGVR